MEIKVDDGSPVWTALHATRMEAIFCCGAKYKFPKCIKVQVEDDVKKSNDALRVWERHEEEQYGKSNADGERPFGERRV